MTKTSKRLLVTSVLAVIAVVMAMTSVKLAFAGTDSQLLKVSLRNGGNASVTLKVSAEKAESYGAIDLSGFVTLFGNYIDILNGYSEDVDVLKVENYSEYDGGYSVTVSTRRIDKIGGLGDIYYRVGSTFSTFSQNMEKIEDYYDVVSDRVTYTVFPRTEGGKTQITHKFRVAGLAVTAKKIDGDSLKNVNYNQFSSYLSSTKDKIITFKTANLAFSDEIIIRFNGNLRYVSSECVEVIDSGTVKITPVTVQDQDTGEDVKLYLGYLTFRENLSGFAIGAIIVAGIGFATLVFCFIRFKWITKFKHSKLKRDLKKYSMLYVMLIPAFVLLFLFHYLPLTGLVTAFQKYDLFDGYASEFIGLKNFRNILFAVTSDKMYQIFRNTIYISLIRIVTNFPVILVLALVVHSIKNKMVRGVFQAVSFIPYFISWAAVGGMAYALLDSNSGLLNTVLKALGAEGVRWYSTPDPWWIILAITSLWKGMGWGTLIYIAAMCNIDTELYEACAIDGGGVIRQAFTVTVPSIMSVICLQLILDTGNIMKDNYEQILALIPGDTSAVNSTVEVIGKYTVSQLNGSGMGSATAMGLIQSIIGVILVLVTNRIIKKTENEGIL